MRRLALPRIRTFMTAWERALFAFLWLSTSILLSAPGCGAKKVAEHDRDVRVRREIHFRAKKAQQELKEVRARLARRRRQTLNGRKRIRTCQNRTSRMSRLLRRSSRNYSRPHHELVHDARRAPRKRSFICFSGRRSRKSWTQRTRGAFRRRAAHPSGSASSFRTSSAPIPYITEDLNSSASPLFSFMRKAVVRGKMAKSADRVFPRRIRQRMGRAI